MRKSVSLRAARAWRRIYGPRRRYHFGWAAGIYVFVTLLVALGAFNSQNNLLFWALGFSFATLVVSGLLSGRMLMGIDVERRSSRTGQVGDVIDLRYRVRNRNRVTPSYALWLDEARGRGGERRARPGLGRIAFERRGFVEHVGPRGVMETSVPVRLLSRGVLRLSTMRISTGFPFGLIRKSVEFDEPMEMLIRPKVHALRGGLLRETRRDGTSHRTSNRKAGVGDDFFALREYVAGDQPRMISWRATARRQAMSAGGTGAGTGLMIRQTSAPTPTRMWVVVRFGVGATHESVERVISLAASVAAEGVREGMLVGMAAPRVNLLVRPGSGMAHLDRMLDALARLSVPGGSRGAVEEEFPRAASGPGTRCVIVHAGEIEQGFGPGAGAAEHLSEADLERLIAGSTVEQGHAGKGTQGPRGRAKGGAAA